MDFHDIFKIDPAWDKEDTGTFCGRLFHALLDCFTFLKLVVAEDCAHWVLIVD